MSLWQSFLAFFKGPPDELENSNPFVRRGALWAHLALRLSLAAGVVSVLVYAATQRGDALRIAGLGLLLLCASFLVGGTLGFLFGIPKKLQQTPAPASSEPAEGSAGSDADDDAPKPARRAASYESNTSLEQISDWLTKIIVGLTLTQWNEIRTGFQDMVQYMAPSFGTSGEVFAGGLIVLGSICGFFFGYLPTRLFLWLALTESDLQGDRLAEARKEKNLQEAEALRSQTGGTPNVPAPAAAGPGVSFEVSATASAPPPRVAALVQEYKSLSANLRPGADRTRRLEAIVSEMRRLAPGIGESARATLQKSGSPGERLAAVAWLQVYPREEALEWLGDRIGAEKPFVGYHAAVALLAAARDSSLAAPAVLDAVKRAQSYLEPGDSGTDRAKVLTQAEREARSRL